MSYKTYDEYVDSEVEWFSQIPSHWSLCKIKNNINYYLNGAWGSEENNDENDIVCVRIADFEYDKGSLKDDDFTIRNIIINDKRLMLKKGDLLIEKSGGGEKVPVGRVVMFDKDFEAVSSNFISKIRLNESNYSKFFLYLFNFLYSSKVNTKSIKQTTGIQNLDSYSYFNENIFIPKYSEQKQIANYLDKKTSEIDKNIDKNKELISLLEEKKTALINQAVTKGLDPDVPMKDSGIEWIGEIPKHWELKSIRRVLIERNEKNNPIQSKERLSLSIDKGVTLYAEKTTNLDRFKDDFTQYKLAYEGDLVLNSMNMIVGAVGVSNYFGCVSPAYYTYYDNTIDNTSTKYVDYLFKTKTIKKVLRSLGRGIMSIDRGDDRINTCRLKVSRDDLRNLLIPTPPLEEQREINSFLDEEINKSNEIIKIINVHIGLLEEYKDSLIHHVVTGKIDVRDEI